jgi:hypothetical protein
MIASEDRGLYRNGSTSWTAELIRIVVEPGGKVQLVTVSNTIRLSACVGGIGTNVGAGAGDGGDGTDVGVGVGIDACVEAAMRDVPLLLWPLESLASTPSSSNANGGAEVRESTRPSLP